jgi:hypothetical protein
MVAERAEGLPHTFSLILNLDSAGAPASAAFVDQVIAEVNRAKPARSTFTFTRASPRRPGSALSPPAPHHLRAPVLHSARHSLSRGTRAYRHRHQCGPRRAVNAANTGTRAVTIAQVGLSGAALVPGPARSPPTSATARWPICDPATGSSPGRAENR